MPFARGPRFTVWTPASDGDSSGRRRAGLLWLSALALAALGVGAIDVVTGREVLLAPLYVPIVISSARRSGRVGAAWSALGCAAIGILADHLVSEPLLALATSYSGPAIPWWNGLARLIVFLIVGLTVVELEEALHEREASLREARRALDQVRTLEGLLPICAWCKRIRDEEQDGEWLSVEHYIARKTSAEFSHGICPQCVAEMRHSVTADRAE